MRDIYWVDTDRDSLKFAVNDVTDDGGKVTQIVVINEQEIWLLVSKES